MEFYFSDDCLVQLVFQCPGAMENHRSTVFREKSIRHDTYLHTTPAVLNSSLPAAQLNVCRLLARARYAAVCVCAVYVPKYIPAVSVKS